MILFNKWFWDNSESDTDFGINHSMGEDILKIKILPVNYDLSTYEDEGMQID